MAAENMSRSGSNGSNGSNGSSEAPKPQKRKGTRSVASLTPQQLARKRANDREAQRAIRQRTKEHIERLEREVAALKTSQKNGAILALMERNRHLEAELHRLKTSMGYPTTAPSFHSSPVFDEAALGGGMAGASPRSSPYPNSAFDGLEDLTTPTAPFMAMEGAPLYVAGSTASSPASSSNQDEFTTYIPSTLGPSMAMSIASQQAAQVQFRGDFDDGDAEAMYSGVSQQQYRHQAQAPQQQQKQQQQPANWSYQGYYGSSNSPLPSTA